MEEDVDEDEEVSSPVFVHVLVLILVLDVMVSEGPRASCFHAAIVEEDVDVDEEVSGVGVSAPTGCPPNGRPAVK